MRLTLLLSLVLLWSCSLIAQDALKLVSNVQVIGIDIQSRYDFGRAICNERGTVLLPGGDHIKIASVIDSSGNVTQLARPERFSDWQQWVTNAFAGSSAGFDVIVSGPSSTPQANRPPQVEFHLLRYGSSGAFVSNRQLNIDFMPWNVAAFSSGRYLIEGVRTDKLKGPNKIDPVLAIVGADGEVIRTIMLPGDVAHPEQLHESPIRGTPEYAFHWSKLVSGDDGKVYLIRNSPTGPVYSVSDSGEVSQYVLQPPAEAPIFVAAGMREGKLAVVFVPERHLNGELAAIAQILDAKTGTKFAQYRQIEGYTWGPVCVSPSSLTYLSTMGGTKTLTLTVLRPNTMN